MVTPLRPRNGELVYVAGPISANPEFNLADSARICKLLTEQGHAVIDAAAIEHDGHIGQAPGYDWHDYMDDDIRVGLMVCSAICLRPQWPYSRGAKEEFNIAATIGLDIYFWYEDIQGMIPMGERL